MRKLVIGLVGFELLALGACGYTLAEDKELTGAISWAREFKAKRPDAARAIARSCTQQLATGPYFSRDGAVQLFACMRREAQAQGHA
jgi:hypothetical protein